MLGGHDAKNAMVAWLSLFLLMGLSACGTDQWISSADSVSNSSENFVSAEGQRAKVTAGNVEAIITLNSSKAATDFVQMLLLELTLIERNRLAKGMTLSRTLSTDEGATREYKIGDFGYWVAGADLAIFYGDIYDQTIVPVIPLGRAEAGAKNMRNTSGTVKLELVQEQAEEDSDE